MRNMGLLQFQVGEQNIPGVDNAKKRNKKKGDADALLRKDRLKDALRSPFAKDKVYIRSS